MRLTYRKALNRGWEPVWYYGKRGGWRAAAITKRGRKWMHIMYADGSNSKVKLTEERYMRHFKSKRG